MDWIIALISGAIGGNLAGGVLKKFSLGALGNTLAGVVGGAGGLQLLAMLGSGSADPAAGASFDIGSLISQIAASGAGGGVAMVVVSQIKRMIGK